MEGDIKCLIAASNQCILHTNCVNKNVKHKVIRHRKVQDLKITVAELQETKILLGICIALQFVI